MKFAATFILCLGILGKSLALPAQQASGDSGNDDQSQGPDVQQSSSRDQSSQAPPASSSAAAAPRSAPGGKAAPSGSVDEIRGLVQRPDGVADYLQSIRRPGLRMTVDTVDEGFKKKNVNSFEDPNIKIKDKNSTDFTRNGQVQNFQGPNFNLRTAVLRENTEDKTRTHVITAQDSEKNFTRKNDRLTQFVGTLDTDQFSAGALLTDHSNRAVAGSVRRTNDGNQESRSSKQNTNNIVRGSFLKAGNLSINSRFQSDSFSNRERAVSDIVLGDSSASDAAATGAEDQQDEQ